MRKPKGENSIGTTPMPPVSTAKTAIATAPKGTFSPATKPEKAISGVSPFQLRLPVLDYGTHDLGGVGGRHG